VAEARGSGLEGSRRCSRVAQNGDMQPEVLRFVNITHFPPANEPDELETVEQSVSRAQGVGFRRRLPPDRLGKLLGLPRVVGHGSSNCMSIGAATAVSHTVETAQS
jgi:hypothetical protein